MGFVTNFLTNSRDKAIPSTIVENIDHLGFANMCLKIMPWVGSMEASIVWFLQIRVDIHVHDMT